MLSAKLPKEAVWTCCLLLPHQFACFSSGLWFLSFQVHQLTQWLKPQLIHTILSNLAKNVSTSQHAVSLASRLVIFARCLHPEKTIAKKALPQSLLFLTFLVLFHIQTIIILQLSGVFFFDLYGSLISLVNPLLCMHGYNRPQEFSFMMFPHQFHLLWF